MINIKKLLKGLKILGSTDQTASLDLEVDSSGNASITSTGTLTVNGNTIPTDFIQNGANVGGEKEVFKQKSGTDLQFRTLKAGANIALTQNANDVTIDASAAGEANTASNVGGEKEVFKQKVGVDLQFRTLKAGTNVTLTQNTNDVTINASASGSTTKMSVVAFNTASFGIPNNAVTKVIFNIVDFDPNSMYNATTGEFTIPSGTVGTVAGVIGGKISLDSNAITNEYITYMRIFKNGTFYKDANWNYSDVSQNPNNVQADGTIAFVGVANDVFDVRFFQKRNSGTSFDLNTDPRYTHAYFIIY